MRRLLRGVAYAALPAEAGFVVCLLAGVALPAPALYALEVLVVATVLLDAAVYRRARRRGLPPREALYEVVPEPVVRLAGHELGLMVSLVRWAGRRRHGVRGGVEAFGHARDQAALMYGFAFVCAVEAVGVSWLLWDVPVVHEVFLVLDVYTVLFVLGVHAASVTRPHLLDGRVLRLRQGGHVDLAVPLGAIAAVRYEPLFTHRKADGELDLKVGGQTSLTLELASPVEAVGLLGGRREVRVVRFHADDPRALYAALRRVRTAPSPAPGTPV
ncbi:hypothetical protein [Streptomyces sudanensis]|uniref:hypothetical protein n=1 Tax=Streptomyces sudanensis TaxID=436397 RepID=UPI0020CFE762|nr:hypothetical protein [Streptomyces sudanensis]MCP9959185.1 hypothetical protein [Streptomyces sudanensis]MCQ0000354.1 hypothetical protein [Streptomyces sudanensis]